MSKTTANITAEHYSDKTHEEYIRSNKFKPYMGTGENKIIQVCEDLTKKKGEEVTANLVGALEKHTTNDGTVKLVDNETALPHEGFKVRLRYVRDAVLTDVTEERASNISIFRKAKPALKPKAMNLLKLHTIEAMFSTGVDATNGKVKTIIDPITKIRVDNDPANNVNYQVAATIAEKNAWIGTNVDRVLFGNDVANLATGDFAASLGNIGTEGLTTEVVTLLRDVAEDTVTSDKTGIRPYSYGEDNEMYVLFVGTKAFRQLERDPQMVEAHKHAMQRGIKNPLFREGDLMWRNVLIRKIHEIPQFTQAGVNYEPVALCGAQSLVMAWGQRFRFTQRKEDDYGLYKGAGFDEFRNVNKIQWQGRDWGQVTGFVRV